MDNQTNDKKIISKDISKDIMQQIKSKKVTMKSRYLFVAQKIGLGSTLVLSIILAIFFVNLVLFYLDLTNNLEFLSFGKYGILAFLENFPYVWILFSIVFILIAGYIIRKYEISYKKSFGYILVGIIGFIIISAVGFTYSGVNEHLEQRVLSHTTRNHPLKLFYARQAFKGKHVVFGQVVSYENNKGVLKTHQGEVHATVDPRLLKFHNIKIGDYIVLVGFFDDDVFNARSIQEVQKLRGKMIEKRFEHAAARVHRMRRMNEMRIHFEMQPRN